MNKKRLRRTLLYVPSSNPSMIQDAVIYGSDSIVFDLEDSVSVNEKDSARFLLHQALRTLDFGDKELIVRINDLSTPFGREDLYALVPLAKVVIRLPKTESAGDMATCEEIITEIEKTHGIPVGSTKMMASIETAKGVLNAQEIAESSSRLVGISIGAEDYVTDLGTVRSADGTELLLGRSMVVLAAKAAGIDAIDTIYSDLDNVEGLIRETQHIKQLGFVGKSVINPRQIEHVHGVFTPTAEEVEHALGIREAAREAEEKGAGVIALNGKMVDKPIITRAEQVLRLAKAVGMIGEEQGWIQ